MTGSVTNWIRLLQAGDTGGAQPLFNRYFELLVSRCQAQMSGKPPRAADGEDVAQQVLASFFRQATEKRYPDLKDRDSLWKLLLTIASNKAKSLIKQEGRDKRGGNKVVGENVLAGSHSVEGWNIDLEMGDEPTPETVASLNELLQGLYASLEDPQLRQILELKLAGYTNLEIAKEMNCSLATVERRLRRIRDLLTERWGTLGENR